MDWLKYLGLQPAPPNPIMTNPVGTSTTQRLTNPSPTVSPVASAILDSPEQRIGRFWNLATGRGKAAYTGADMPALAASGNEAIDAGTGWATTTPIRAFHGSPHTFDRFSMGKIGTGEGAQAYGHGLYFAGNEGVARSYRDALSNFRTGPEAAKAYLDSAGGDVAQAIAKMRDHAVNGGIGASTEEMNAIRQGLALLQKGGDLSGLKAPGSMYEVNLRTSPERLLDWDKPLSAQPGAREAIARAYENRGMFEKASAVSDGAADAWNGGKIIESVGMQNRPAFTEQLRAAGLDGIQYLDAGSRAAGDGSRNYVIFDDKLIDILRRYGLFGLGMTGGAMGAAQTYAPQGAEQ